MPAGTIVADASFLIAVAQDDPLAARFATALRRSVATSVNFGEVLYKLHQKAAMAAATTEAVFTALGVSVEDVALAHARHFPRLKEIDAASRSAQRAAGVAPTAVKSLSLADMTCLAYADEHDLPVLSGDRHWLSLGAQGLQLAVYDFRDPTLGM